MHVLREQNFIIMHTLIFLLYIQTEKGDKTCMHVCMSVCMYVCKHTIQPATLEGNVLPSMNKNIAITFFL
jgi:hypothetical protein